MEARPESAGVALDPDAPFGLWERGTVIASLAIPAKAGVGEEGEGLIWVRGDGDHVLRWTVRVTSHAGNCCHEVDITDWPDPCPPLVCPLLLRAARLGRITLKWR